MFVSIELKVVYLQMLFNFWEKIRLGWSPCWCIQIWSKKDTQYLCRFQRSLYSINNQPFLKIMFSNSAQLNLKSSFYRSISVYVSEKDFKWKQKQMTKWFLHLHECNFQILLCQYLYYTCDSNIKRGKPGEALTTCMWWAG